MTGKKKIVWIIILALAGSLWVMSFDFSDKPEQLTYGVSFSRFHADELKLDWKDTYLALLNDLGVRHFRFSVHWPLTESKNDKFNFSELDFQMDLARSKDADVILAIGRRVPGWPECHEPSWALNLDKEKKQKEILEYIEKVVQRYQGYPNLLYWQVENEPFLTFFSRSACGELDKNFLDMEIALVRELDPVHKIIITDSGEFGTWFEAYKRGDIFGTSMYLYIWNRRFGPIQYPILPSFFRIKHNLLRLFLGLKEVVVIELEAEPWLLLPIIDTPIDVQMDRMGLDKFENMIKFSSKTGFDTFYFWGAEWWYWMKKNGHPEFWERAQKLFTTPESM